MSDLRESEAGISSRARRFGRVAVGLLVVGIAGGALAQRVGNARPRATAGAGTLDERMVAQAAVVAVEGVAEVRARVEGRVVSVLVREGERVTEGQLLAEIESEMQSAETSRRAADRLALLESARAVARGARPEEQAAAEAEARAAREELALARDRAARAEQIASSGSGSAQSAVEARQGFRAAEARAAAVEARWRLTRGGGRAEDVRAARARVTAAEALEAQARSELSRTRLLAPAAGIVLARRVDPGDTTMLSAASPPAFEIADPGRTELRLEVEESDAERLRVGALVRVVRLGGRGAVGTAHIARVGGRLDRRSIGADDGRVRSDGLVRPAWASWDAPTTLPIGLHLEGEIMAPRSVLTRVPREAVTVRLGRAVVRVPWGVWSRERPVTLGSIDPRFVEVSGIPGGTTVLLSELGRLAE
ncbi:MAG: biotin/lipoyl-binding protein [Deltaproteobacteria bacterium]|nr:biotin/lipoyl-binding protein [Deltaproteobacteria bacterium]MBP6830528.1 biotin/lipoyl-binding protein [Deltaproteobacteria bacterium]